MRRNLTLVEGGGATDQAAQRGAGVPISGVIQSSFGHCSVQPTLGEPAQIGGMN